MSDQANAETTTKEAQKVPETTSEKMPENMSNILSHIKNLEVTKQDLEKALKEANDRNQKLSQKTREGMQSALDTLMKKWMDAVETKDEKVKHDFKGGLEKLVSQSAEDNGVWQMMVAASSLHARQQHDLDEIQRENKALKERVDGLYASPESRMAGGKRPAEEQLDRQSVDESQGPSIWDDFAASVGRF
tara:strand:+ start:2473 stop:3042 length:570 start_codon:yes stop_codon:yes gene_type:complete